MALINKWAFFLKKALFAFGVPLSEICLQWVITLFLYVDMRVCLTFPAQLGVVAGGSRDGEPLTARVYQVGALVNIVVTYSWTVPE